MGSKDTNTLPTKRASSPSQTPHLYPVPGSSSREASRPATSGAIGFLDLPKWVRQNVYKRVLVVGHSVHLFQDFGPRVETFAPDRPKRWLALLYTNRQVYGEAKAVLYGKNNVYLMDRPQQQDVLLRSFLNGLGSLNADFLSRLSISFPVAERTQDQSDTVKIREDSLQNLSLLQEKCTKLTTLEMNISTENSSFLTEAAEDKSHFVREALLQIDAQLKAVSSVKKVVVRLYIHNLSPLIVDSMQGLGWVVLDR